jgi:hypothetical protein
MSPTGPLYAGTAVDSGIGGGGAWTNPGNATGINDNVYAAGNISGGGSATNWLKTTGYGFNLPNTAIIDGIKVEYDRKGTLATGSMAMVKGGTIDTANAKSDPGDFWPTSEAYFTYGGPTEKWGQTWLYSDINASTFGAACSAQNTHGGGNANVDAVRITVYWHTAPTVIPRTKYYLYKVYDSITGSYLGNLPNVITDFALSQDINSAGVQITVQCGISADTNALPADTLTDETPTTLIDESGNILTDEGTSPPTGIGTSGAIIRNGNRVRVYEYSYYYPNGTCLFSGIIERHEDNFGGDTGDNHVQLLIYSDSSDMDNHLVRGNPFVYTLDQSQTSQDNRVSVIQTSIPPAWSYYGQTFTVGAGVTNLGAIVLLLDGIANVTVSVYDSTLVGTGATLLGSVTQSVSVVGPTGIQFNFASHIPVTAATQYFFTVSVDANQSIWLQYQDTNVYAGGGMYSAIFTGTSGGTYSAVASSDLYFQTYSSTGSTNATFTAVDPTTGMVASILSDYNTEGGLIRVGNIEATGLSLNYGLNTQTVFQALQSSLTVSPNGFYFYIDVGNDLIYLQQASAIADIVLTKGVHINKLKIVSTIEYVINAAYVVGAVVSGSNIYTLDTDPISIALYGLRLQVHTDNNIPDVTTGHIVGSGIVDDNKGEQYQTTVTIPAETMDITQLIPGKVIGFNGFGTYVDFLLAQIVHRDYTPGAVTLTLGILPKRNTTSVEQVVRGLSALSTITNPTSPS